MMFLTSAKYVHDVESGLDFVRVEHTNHAGDVHVDCLATQPLGDWVEIESLRKSVRLDKFLNTMVAPTVEVLQKMCETVLTIILEDLEPGIKTQVWLMHTMRILDPTFTPPWVNPKASWQRTYVWDTLNDTFYDLIERTTDARRLEKLFNVLRVIELQVTL